MVTTVVVVVFIVVVVVVFVVIVVFQGITVKLTTPSFSTTQFHGHLSDISRA